MGIIFGKVMMKIVSFSFSFILPAPSAGVECFGLLGPHGAGKTTLQDMLTGLQRADGGSATIAGFDISTQMRKVHRIIGVCPQFDKIWPELSVRHRARPFPAI